MSADNPTPVAQSERPSLKRLRQVVSLGALLLALAHIVWPQLAIDAVALALIVIAILPWLAPLVKSLELPGGWKVEFQELQRAASRAIGPRLLTSLDERVNEAPHLTSRSSGPPLAAADFGR